MGLSIVKSRLEAKQSPCYQNPAEFVSDIQLIFRNCAVLNEVTAHRTTMCPKAPSFGLPLDKSIKYLRPVDDLFHSFSVLFVVARQADTEVATAGRKLEELFEGHLRILYPDQAFPQIKTEVVSPAMPPVSQPLSPEEMRQPAERQHKCSESQVALSSPRGEEEAV